MAVTIQTVNRGTIPGDGTGDTAYDGTGKINTNFTNLKAAADLVLDVPETYMLGRITASTGDVEQLTPEQVRTILALPKESGFIDRADSTLSFVAGTRTFTIQPSATSYQYWENNVLYTKSAPDNVIITDVEGLHYIYFDGATLTHTTTFTPLLITEYAFVCAIYWDATNNVAIILGDERHGHIMDSATHIYNHLTFGARYGDGLGLGNITTGGTGNAAADAQFSVASGSLWDEDIEHTVTDGSPQTLSTAAEIPIIYRSGANGDWRKNAATVYPIAVGATPLAQYNQWTGATWQLTEITSGNYVLYHYYATNDILEPIIGIPGIAQYNSLADAQAAADSELFDIAFGGLADLTPEFIPIATVIWESRTSFTNAVSSRTRPTQDGDDYIDWRGASGGAGGGTGGGTDIDPDAIHVNIGAEIQPITLKATPVGADVLVIEDSAALYVKKSITISGIPHGELANSGTNTHAQIDTHIGLVNEHIDWTNATQNLSTSGSISGSNVSGTNTGDQTDMSGISDTKANFNTSLSDGTFMYVGDAPTAHTHTEDEILVSTNLIVLGRNTAGAGSVEEINEATFKTMMNLEIGTDVAAEGHTHTLSDVTDSGALAALNTVGTTEIDNDAVTYAKMQNVSTTARVLGRNTAGAGDVEEISETQFKALFNLEIGTDVQAPATTLAGYGISDVKANFNIALSDGSFMFVGDAPTAHTHVEADITNLGDYIPAVTTPTTGNFPQLDVNGYLVNSTYDETSFAAASHTHTVSEITDLTNGVEALTTDEVNQLENIGTTVISAADWIALSNLSGTNSGDQTSIVGISGTISQFNTALTDGTFATGGGTATGTNTGDQTSIAGITGTKSQFNTACTDGNFLYVGDVTSDTGTPAILSNGVTPSLNTGITGAEVRSLIGAGTGDGTVTSVSAGVGLDSSGGTAPSITLDFSELVETTSWDHTGGTIATEDSLIMWDISALDERRILLGNIPLSGFNNDAGFTSNTGDITSCSVTAGTNLNGGGSASSGAFSVTVNLDTALTAMASIYGTGLNVGNDSANYIDFATTDFSFIFDSIEDFRFSDGGDFLANGNVTAYSTTISSDRNLKKNIEPIVNALDKVKALTGCSFNWKRDDKSGGGLIAQDVQKVLPDAVHAHEDMNTKKEYLTLDYNHIIGLLVQAINELAAR